MEPEKTWQNIINEDRWAGLVTKLTSQSTSWPEVDQRSADLNKAKAMVSIFHHQQKILFGLKIYQDKYCNYVVRGRYKENHQSQIYVNLPRQEKLFSSSKTHSKNIFFSCYLPNVAYCTLAVQLLVKKMKKKRIASCWFAWYKFS